MKLMKKLMLGAAVALTMTAAQASPISVDGVVWDPAVAQDFFSSIKIRQFVEADGSLSGYGYVTQINGTDENTFCPGCELTFHFSGFTPIVAGVKPVSNGQVIPYSGGTIEVYRHADTGTINKTDGTTATFANTDINGGSLWLKLTGHEINGVSFTGTVIGSPFGGLLSGLGFLDAVGGSAWKNFDTNGRDGGADLGLTSGLSLFRPYDTPTFLDATGDGNMRGNTIPEPGSLALLGLGLLGAAVARRRKA